MFRTLLGGLMAALFFYGVANAAMNLRQDDTGSASWVDGSSNAFPVGAAYLTVMISDVGTASTYVVANPYNNMKIVAIYSALSQALTGSDAIIDLSIDGTQVSNPASADLTITQSGSAEGDVDSLIPTINNNIDAGGAIRVHTDGGPSNTVSVIVTIVLQPRG